MNKYRFKQLLESSMGNVRPIISEQENTNFTNEIMSDLENLGYTKTGTVVSEWEGFIWTHNLSGRFFKIEKGKIMLLFNENYGLLLMTISTKISIANMGSDNLSNSEFAKSFKAYDIDRNILTGGAGMGPEETAPFVYWLTTSFPYQNTTGTSKESTPFYTQYYPDIVKLTQIDDEYSKFSDSSLKDKAEMIGGELKKGFGQLKGAIKQGIDNSKQN
jgi:hypothetical protein